MNSMLIKKSTKFNVNFAQLIQFFKLRCIYQFFILNFYFHRQKAAGHSNSFKATQSILNLQEGKKFSLKILVAWMDIT